MSPSTCSASNGTFRCIRGRLFLFSGRRNLGRRSFSRCGARCSGSGTLILQRDDPIGQSRILTSKLFELLLRLLARIRFDSQRSDHCSRACIGAWILSDQLLQLRPSHLRLMFLHGGVRLAQQVVGPNVARNGEKKIDDGAADRGADDRDQKEHCLFGHYSFQPNFPTRGTNSTPPRSSI